MLSGRVDSLNLLLARKEERLRRQFNSMEQALAELQGQQNAVAQLAALVTSLKQQS